jgi:hypothetical protein
MTVWRSQPGYYEQHYEALRREALEAGERRAHGLSLFLTRGMVGWMRALSVLQSPAEGGLQGSDPGGTPSRVGPIGTWRGEVTHLLAGMILACQEESIHE